jgi:hypothetical protein
LATLTISSSALRAEGLDVAVGLLSDKVTRGFSKSQGRATWEVDALYHGDSGWFVGLGVTDRRPGSASGRFEWVASVGQGWPLDADWTVQIGAARYQNSGGRRTIDADYTDLTVSADWRGRGNLLVTASPDTRTGSRRGWTVLAEASWRQPFADRWSLDIGVGTTDRSGIGSPSYGYGSVGLSASVGPVRVFGTRIVSRAVDSGALPASARASRWVLAVVWID